MCYTCNIIAFTLHGSLTIYLKQALNRKRPTFVPSHLCDKHQKRTANSKKRNNLPHVWQKFFKLSGFSAILRS